MKDIRTRNWLNLNTYASKILQHLIEAENLLGTLDDYQMDNNQCFPDIEELYNEIADFRTKYTEYVDENLDILNIDYTINTN